jgi:CheY-like chemotaxis protein
MQGDHFMVLMDMMMPVMDGYEATRRITQTAKFAIKRPKIIALTASVTEEEVKSAREAGCIDILSKPVNIEKLRTTIYDAAQHYAIQQSNLVSFELGKSHRNLALFME